MMGNVIDIEKVDDDDDNINHNVNDNNTIASGVGDDYQEINDMIVEKNKQGSSQFLVL